LCTKIITREGKKKKEQEKKIETMIGEKKKREEILEDIRMYLEN
jgi:hypothetical protein